MTLPAAKSAPKRVPVTLGTKLDKNLLAYTMAAGAAGIGMLASAAPAEAKIVYTQANIPITVDAGYIYLDLNNDGIADFQFYNVLDTPGARRHLEGTVQASLFAGPAQAGNGIWAQKDKAGSYAYAAAVGSNKHVGPKRPFKDQSLFMAGYAGNYTNPGGGGGPWSKVNSAYLALQFVIKGQTHYGWARIQMGGSNPGINATVVGYAYETVANKPLITGHTKRSDVIASKPATHVRSLGTLALGAAGR